ncbi:MAG: PhnD/SsuA/transferrin family substrate-binding protein [Anaerolineae bacterium]|nr:PhnD/SsuA/transferrin family substrate-binding protein [Anaerolineae bacterium]MDK1118001.1 PhnD/SsuA/transferrin family substrate-binding protein [Anaerolineae bacterium]
MIRLRIFIFYILFLFLLISCNEPGGIASAFTPEPALDIDTALAIAAGTVNAPRPTPTSAVVGTIENPLIIALPPGSSTDGKRVQAGTAFAEQLSEVTGFTFVVVAPESYSRLVEAIGHGNAHIAVLSPYAYVFAYEQGFANAAFASLRSGENAYGAQFIARTEAGFQSYFDSEKEENTGSATEALSQFRDKKPCWSDEVSPSGRIVPAGILAHNDIPFRSAAVLQGQPTVVRAVYVGGICDFGTTYVDARNFPAVLDEYPDVFEQVDVIWRTPSIIPYDVLTIANSLTPEVQLAIRDALFRITGMQAGRQVLGPAYGNENWERITDIFYEEFRKYVKLSGINLENLIQ